MIYQKNKFILLFIISFIYSKAEHIIYTHVSSNSGGNKGIAIQIVIPDTARYVNCGAPVVVFLEGGFDGEYFEIGGHSFSSYGFIEINFVFPGNTYDTLSSGGDYDFRGYYSAMAVKDIILFAQSKQADIYDNYINEYTTNYNITTDVDNVGILAESNGGNLSIVTAAAFKNELNDLAWIVNWESPVGEGMVSADAGGATGLTTAYHNPDINPAFDLSTNKMQYNSLRYSDTLIAIINNSDTTRGNFYFDLNSSNHPDEGIDFILNPISYNSKLTGSGVMWSEELLNYAYTNAIIPFPYPPHIPTTNTAHEFWLYRNAANWEDSIPAQLPFLVIARDSDHVQNIPTHAHIQTQYNLFFNKTPFARVNPDKSYIEDIIGISMVGITDNDANSIVDNSTISSLLDPEKLSLMILYYASICEMADRKENENYTSQLDSIIFFCTNSSSINDQQILSAKNSIYVDNEFNNSGFTIHSKIPIKFIFIYDLVGQLIYNYNNSSFSERVKINFTPLNELYIIKVIDVNENNICFKVFSK